MVPYQVQANNKEQLKRRLCRALVNGPPNSRKTGTLYTCHGPLVCQVAPMEKGDVSLPLATFDGKPVTRLVSDRIDLNKPQDWNTIWNEVVSTTVDILSGKFGEVKTFALDGLHKVYAIGLANASNGANITGSDFDAKIYNKSHSLFTNYLDMILSSQVPYIVMTCWDGAEKDNALDTSKEGEKQKHLYPDLPGQMAKKVMGEFAVVVAAKQEGVGANARFYWQTQPQGYTWGAGVKLPVQLIEKIKLPREMPMDWAKLFDAITTGLDKEWDVVYSTPAPPAA